MTRPPRWTRAVLRFVAPDDRVDDVLGDLAELHDRRHARHGRFVASLLTGLEALDIAVSFIRARFARSQDPDRTSRRPPPSGRRAIAAARRHGPTVSWLDFKLGLRMLVKYPGMTIVAGLAIAFTVTLGVTGFEFASDWMSPRIPLPAGDRLVEIGKYDRFRTNEDPRLLHEYEVWEQELRSVEELGAFMSYRRSIFTDRGGTTVVAADITASALAMARTPPLHGRLLSEADEVPGAPDVAVVGYEVWRSVLGGDPEVVGTEIRVGSQVATVVGVMPEGFRWPFGHGLWQPFRLSAGEFEYGRSPAISVVGRLADGAARGDLQAEVDVIARGLAAAYPEHGADQTASVKPFGSNPLPVVGVSEVAFLVLNVAFFVMLILLVCGNVALLLFARTSARRNEIVVRSALGASRSRIVWQLFVEAMVLTCAGAVLGVWTSNRLIAWGASMIGDFNGEFLLGFWFGSPASGTTMLVAVGLALLAGILCGVMPALKATGGGLGSGLQRAAAGEGRGFGRIWGFLIVSQITVTVAFAPFMVYLGVLSTRIERWDHGLGSARFAYARIMQDAGLPEVVAELASVPYAESEIARRYRDAMPELERRLASRLGAEGVTRAAVVPGLYHPFQYIEVDGPAAPHDFVRGWRVSTASVGDEYFDVLGVPILSGRRFDSGDSEAETPVAIVNEAFVEDVLEGRNPIGRRFAFVLPSRADPPRPDSLGPWVEIVGVVKQIAMNADPEFPAPPGLYLPLKASDRWQYLIARTDEDVAAFAPDLRQMALDVEPSLLVQEVRPLEESTTANKLAYQSWFLIVVVSGGIGMLLATAGIYSIMSYTVSRRTREIGVRVALGAARHRILASVFGRSFRQIATGVLLGALLFTLFLAIADGGPGDLFDVPSPRDLVWVGLLIFGMTIVCSLACIVPTRRALAIEPTEALKSD